jgi:hypothetical protein
MYSTYFVLFVLPLLIIGLAVVVFKVSKTKEK